MSGADIFTINPPLFYAALNAGRQPLIQLYAGRSSAPATSCGTPLLRNRIEWPLSGRHAVCSRHRSASPFLPPVSPLLPAPDFPIVDQRRINQLLARGLRKHLVRRWSWRWPTTLLHCQRDSRARVVLSCFYKGNYRTVNMGSGGECNNPSPPGRLYDFPLSKINCDAKQLV